MTSKYKPGQTGKTKVRVTREALREHIKEQFDSMPDNAELVGVDYDAETDSFEAVFIADDLPETWEGGRIKRFEEYGFNNEQ